MTVVIGTAGHIDHGKTTLLRALTGIDADRLPEERRRGLTIDVGYAHGSPDGGPAIDFVDVPGHDRLVGNMLVGAGEVDACLLVVAADDGPRAQTWEHLGLIDALRIGRGLVAITKVDLVEVERATEVSGWVRAAIDRSVLAGSPVIAVSATTGQGMDRLRRALAELRDAISGPPPRREGDGARLAIDRVFTVRGRGVVVTGTSRGAVIELGTSLQVLPGRLRARVRGIQVHDADVAAGPHGGRVALNLVGMPQAALRRGLVLATAPSDRDPLAMSEADRLLVALERPMALPSRPVPDAWPPRDGAEARLHVGTDQVTAILGRSGRDAVELPDGRALAMLRLAQPVGIAIGDRFVLRQPPPVGLLAGGLVIDVRPPSGRSRRRQTAAPLGQLAWSVSADQPAAMLDALVELHGYLALSDGPGLAADVHGLAVEVALGSVRAHQADRPSEPGLPMTVLRAGVAAAVRAEASVSRQDAAGVASAVIDRLVSDGRLVRVAEAVHTPDHRASEPDPEREQAMDRLVALLDVDAPPALSMAAREARCPPEAVRELERDGRLVIVAEDLAWSAQVFARLSDQALELASDAPLTPARLRDATGSSRRYVTALLEDLDRRALLRRTPAGHVPGPRAQRRPST